MNRQYDITELKKKVLKRSLVQVQTPYIVCPVYHRRDVALGIGLFKMIEIEQVSDIHLLFAKNN